MLSKLAFKNVGKSLRDYAVYFFTLAFGVCVFYMFNSVYAQQALLNLSAVQSKSVEALNGLLSYISVFVAITLGFLIVYANNFFIKRRKKELGIYMTLGMRKREISVILTLETSLMAVLALVFGLAAGIVLSQFMSLFTAKMFEADLLAYKFIFAPKALVKSIIYFSIIFVIVILFNVFAIRKFKLIDLIYGEKRNEKMHVKNTTLLAIICVLSILILGAAYYLIIKNGMLNINGIFLVSIILGTIGTLMFFFSISGLLITLVRANKKLYYKNLNMFVARQLGSKINSNFVSISVVCIILLLAIGIFSCGYSLQYVYSATLKGRIAFDCSIYDFYYEDEANDPDYVDYEKFGGIKRFLDSNTNVKEYSQCSFYDQGITYSDFLLSLPEGSNREYLAQATLSFISLSDFNANMAMQGKPSLTLESGKYMVMCDTDIARPYAEEAINAGKTLNINGATLSPQGIIDVAIDNASQAICFVVNDEYVKNAPMHSAVLNVVCISEEAEKDFYTQLVEYESAHKDHNDRGYSHYRSRSEEYAASVTTSAIASFLSIYLGLVFMTTCAAVLAIQQLTDAADNKERYALLSKLGADKKMLNKTLLIQILCYFLFPLILAIIHSYVGLSTANTAFESLGRNNMAQNILVTALFVGVLYAAYFVMTYVGSKSVIDRS